MSDTCPPPPRSFVVPCRKADTGSARAPRVDLCEVRERERATRGGAEKRRTQTEVEEATVLERLADDAAEEA